MQEKIELEWQYNLSDSQLTLLAAEIKKLHEEKWFPETPSLTITGLASHQLEKAEKLASDPDLSALKDITSMYNRLLPMLKPEVSSHNRMSSDNILYNGIFFLFFNRENTTVNDPLYDLAFLSCNFFLSPDQEKVLLKSYLGHEITLSEDRKFYLMKLLVLCHLAIDTITTCQDVELIKSSPPIASDQRYFNNKEKVLNLQTNSEKFLNYQLLVNKIQFIMQTGKFLACENSLLKTKKQEENLAFNTLPLLAQQKIFSFIPKDFLAKSLIVAKDWARIYSYHTDDNFPELEGIEKVDPDLQPRLLAAIQQVFMPYKRQKNTEIDAILSPKEIASIVRFNSGISPWANTYQLTINDNHYAIRLMSLEPDASCAKLEISIMQLFSAIGISPKIHYASHTQGVIIMDFVDANPAWHLAIKPEIITQLGLIFNLMEDVSLDSTKPLFSNKRKKEIYEQAYKICREDFATDLRFDLFRDILTELDTLKPLCDELTEYTICHHDFNVRNLLQQKADQSFKVIDFEISESGDRLFDLGSLASFMLLNKEAETELLSSFFGREATEREQSKYYLFKQYARLHYIVMGLGAFRSLDFTVTQNEIDELPPYNEYSYQAMPLNFRTDVGLYKLATMFIKQAKIDSQKEEYLSSLDYFSSKTEDISHGITLSC